MTGLGHEQTKIGCWCHVGFQGQSRRNPSKSRHRGRTSGVEGRADHRGHGPAQLLVAKPGHSRFVKYHRTLAHRDSGVGNRPLHLAQSVEVCALIDQAGIRGESPHTTIPQLRFHGDGLNLVFEAVSD